MNELPSFNLIEEMVKAEKKASWIQPVAAMIQHDVFPSLGAYENVTGVFIGPWTRSFVEANAFRIACERLDIQQHSVFLIEQNPIVIERSIGAPVRDRMRDSLSRLEEVKPLIDIGVVRLGDDDFRLYTSNDFVGEIDSGQESKLPPIVLINGNAGDPKLAQVIVQAIPQGDSLLVIGRNVDPVPFSYRQVVETWAQQITLRHKRGKTSTLVFTATDQRLAEIMYDYILAGVNGLGVNNGDQQSSDNLDIDPKRPRVLTPRGGLLLSYRPMLENRGAHFSDNYIHIIGERLPYG